MDRTFVRQRGGLSQYLVLAMLICLALLVIPYCFANYILMALAKPYLEERQAQLELGRIVMTPQGLHLTALNYREPGIAIDDAAVRLPLSSLFQWDRISECVIFCDGLQVDLSAFQASKSPELEDVSDVEKQAFPFAPACAQVAKFLSVFPLEVGRFEVRELTLQTAEAEQVFRLISTFEGVPSGDSECIVSLTGEWLQAKAKLWSFAGADGLGLDYSVQFTNWEALLGWLAPDSMAALADQQIDLYLDPIQEGAPLLDLSGYVRWSHAEPEKVKATVLGNLGPVEVFGPDYDFAAKASSFGFATDGRLKHRAFAEVPVASARYRTWEAAEGLVELQLAEGALKTSLDFPESDFVLKLVHANWKQALQGQGGVGLHFHDAELNQDTIEAFAPGKLPPGLSCQGVVDCEMELLLDDVALKNVRGRVFWKEATLDWPEKGLKLEGVSGYLDLENLTGPLGELSVAFDSAMLAGMPVDGVDTRIQFTDTETVSVGGFTAGILGGQLSFDGFQVDRATMTAPEVLVRMEAIDLKELAAKVPQFTGDVSGEVSGDLSFGWSPKGPFADDGLLQLDQSVPARLSYQLHGLLTQGMDPESSSFKQYKMAERAFEDLSLQRLQIELFPEGNANRPVRLKLYGESHQDNIVVPVDYTLNVNVDDPAGLMQLLQMMQRGELEFN